MELGEFVCFGSALDQEPHSRGGQSSVAEVEGAQHAGTGQGGRGLLSSASGAA